MREHSVSATVRTATAPLAHDSTRTNGVEVGAAKPTHDATPTDSRRAADLPGGDVPLRSAIETLLQLANTGRADAMRELALRLMPAPASVTRTTRRCAEFRCVDSIGTTDMSHPPTRRSRRLLP